MEVDIYITERNGNREVRIPVLPETIKSAAGDTTFYTYDIMGKGEMSIPSGVGLSSHSWSSFFPGKNRTDDSILRGSWQDPATYHNTFMDWKKKGSLLNLLVTGYPINVDVYIEKYSAEASGAFGDMPYEITFKAVGETVTAISTTSASTPAPKRTAEKNDSHTIKPGDTLWGIAQKELGKGSLWQTIYNANKEIIEQTAKKYGKSSSNNGHWIFPGITLKIPQ